jgi:L-asparaginase II
MWIEQRRGGLRETQHPVSAALVEGEKVVWQSGEDLACFWRSGCKPMQLLTSLECLPTEALDWLKDEDLAIGAASHSAEPDHVARVLRLLRHFGLKEHQLRCGAHLPMNEAAAHRLLGRRKNPTQLHSNCSGKHTFMLAAAISQQWPKDYRPSDHPLQVRNQERLTEWSGYAPGVAVDGCGVPTFHMPIQSPRTRHHLGMMVHGPANTPAQGAFHGHLRGQTRKSTGHRRNWHVVTQTQQKMTVKVGAEGLFCIALPEKKQGLIIKVHTGSNDALAVAVQEVLNHLYPGICKEGPWPGRVVKNIAGAVVGERVAVWET